jgi:hypothetical protein
MVTVAGIYLRFYIRVRFRVRAFLLTRIPPKIPSDSDSKAVVNVEHVAAYKKLIFYVITVAANGFCYETPVSVTLLIILNARGRCWFTELASCDRKTIFCSFSSVFVLLVGYEGMTHGKGEEDHPVTCQCRPREEVEVHDHPF